jgi:hypothetical protein
MAKKRANKAGKRTFRNGGSTDVRRQKLRRRSGDVKRVELILKADNPRDQYIADYLNRLEYGTTSEFVRQAIEEKIAREIAPPEPPLTIDEMRAIVADEMRAQLSNVTIEQAQVQRVTFGNTPPPEPAQTVSSGIDMSSPRKRPKLQPAQPAQIEAAEPDVLTEAESVRLGRMMAASIRKAQPGRRQ